MEVSLRSYPKVNIGLYVSRKREDGFHNLISIFQKIDCIYDTINIIIEEDLSNSVEVFGLENYVEMKKSTVYKAAVLWLNEQEKNYKIKINIEKKIPVRSGLGSPSSNAATVLIGLEMLCGNRMESKKLMSLGSEIGSDVPFFLCSSDAAIVTSRGDEICPIKPRTDIEFKLVEGEGEKLSTGFAYSELDKRKEIRELPKADYLLDMYYSDISKWDFSNDFETICKKPKCKDKIMLTGSGTYWFIVSNKLT